LLLKEVGTIPHLMLSVAKDPNMLVIG
jgi:hypothetical protein